MDGENVERPRGAPASSGHGWLAAKHHKTFDADDALRLHLRLSRSRYTLPASMWPDDFGPAVAQFAETAVNRLSPNAWRHALAIREHSQTSAYVIFEPAEGRYRVEIRHADQTIVLGILERPESGMTHWREPAPADVAAVCAARDTPAWNQLGIWLTDTELQRVQQLAAANNVTVPEMVRLGINTLQADVSEAEEPPARGARWDVDGNSWYMKIPAEKDI